MKVSIIIPAKEEERVIMGTTCVLKRSLTLPSEIIVSDARSEDRTVEQAKKCADRVVIYDGSVEHTRGRARNDGAKVATGEVLCFMDPDVFIANPNEFFARALHHFASPDVMGVAVSERVRSEVETVKDMMLSVLRNSTRWFRNNVKHSPRVSGKCFFVRRSAFLLLDGFREEMMKDEDKEFFARLGEKGRTVFEPRCVVTHSRHMKAPFRLFV